jgi:hypothetical protein
LSTPQRRPVLTAPQALAGSKETSRYFDEMHSRLVPVGFRGVCKTAKAPGGWFKLDGSTKRIAEAPELARCGDPDIIVTPPNFTLPVVADTIIKY